MYEHAGVMLDMADYAARNSDSVDRELLAAFRNDAMQIRVCVLTALARYACSQINENTCVSEMCIRDRDYSETTIKIMQDLKRIGVSLSLDDFGTGWSSLSYLRKFPLDRIKIDRSFMRDIPTEPAAEAVVKSILSLGRNLGLDCIAEGVETRQQLDYLSLIHISLASQSED